jgi:ketosteroid isomerase-like protein
MSLPKIYFCSKLFEMRCFFISFLLIIFNDASSQKINEVLAAEKAFAQYALEHDTKEAFLYFSDDSGLVFNKGKVNNAKTVWAANPAPATKLLWQPAFFGVAQSGELGFTTGPWEARRSVDDTAFAVGQYTTVWHRTMSGDWRFLADMGITYKGPQYRVHKIKSSGKTKAQKEVIDALAIDKKFIDDYAKKGNDAFAAVLNESSWFNLQGYKPLAGKQQVIDNLSKIPYGLLFTAIGGGAAASKDMAYVYGTVNNGNMVESYLRIWQRFNDGWKIAVQVLKW